VLGARPVAVAVYVVPVTSVAEKGPAGVVVVPARIEYVGVGVPVIPATSKVTVMLLFVGTPETAGTVGGPEGAIEDPVDVEIPTLTALVCEPLSFTATDLK